MKNYNYNIGIDIGTNSIGWAAVDIETNKIIRKFNKKLWGALLFDEAVTAEKCRNFRSTRKRYDRRRKRIKLLRKEFQEEINKVDVDFFQRMKEFSLWKEDKTIQNEKFFKEYAKKYPTIFHLRKELIDNEEQKDIRLVYLAIHHIIKYRGNFLYETENFQVENIDINQKMEEILDLMKQFCPNVTVNSPKESLNSILDASENKEEDLQKYYKNLFGANEKEWTNMIQGKKFTISKIFQLEMKPEKDKISFKDTDYEESITKLETEIKDLVEIIEQTKQIYNIIFLKKILSKEKYISHVMVNNYQKHSEDLKLLRKVLKRLNREDYIKVFVNKKNCSKTERCVYNQ